MTAANVNGNADGDGEAVGEERGEREPGVRREPVGVVEGMRYHVRWFLFDKGYGAVVFRDDEPSAILVSRMA